LPTEPSRFPRANVIMDQNMSRNASELRLLATFPKKDVTYHENASSDNGRSGRTKNFLVEGGMAKYLFRNVWTNVSIMAILANYAP
jgi:hypothetical protein